MKIAVLFSGEYRTFGLCRNTMKFLDSPDIDIYFSTWNKTVYTSKKMGFHVEEDVSEDQIRNDLGKDATMLIERHNLIKERRYNTKLIYRWKRGIQTIIKSGKKYDYILILRPDLFFNKDSVLADNTFSFADQYKDSLGFAWLRGDNFLNDVMIFGSYEQLTSLIIGLDLSEWINSPNGDWHTWWYAYVTKKFPIKSLTELDRFIFCRHWVKDTDTYDRIAEIESDWHDLRILQLLDDNPREVLTFIPDDLKDRAIKKWNDGIYVKYTKKNI